MPPLVQTHATAFPAGRFRTLDGRAELAVAEAASAPLSRPMKVTAVLAAVYGDVAGDGNDPDLIRRVSSAGREWLLHRAARRFFGPANWFEASCEICDTPFDLQVPLGEMPVEEAGPGFPVANVTTSRGQRQFAAPNGAHEEAFAGMRKHTDPRRTFAALCGMAEAAEADAIRFTDADLARVDGALEDISPQIADGAEAACPTCNARVEARIDPLSFAFPRLEVVLSEVHLLAVTYGWSEAEILSLPLARRRAYAELIRKASGAHPAARPASRPRGGFRGGV